MAKKAVKKKKSKPKLVDDKSKRQGEQIPLIDVTPVYAKKLIAAAELYEDMKVTRMDALDDEIAQKKIVLDYMHDKIEPDEKGNRVFEYRDIKITVTVTEMKENVKVKRKKDPGQYEED